MNIKRRLKKLEQETNVDQQQRITINMIPAIGFPFSDELEQCASYRRQAAEREKSDQLIGMLMIFCDGCKEECQYAR